MDWASPYETARGQLNSMIERLKQLQDLSLPEWRVLATAMVLLPLVELGLRLCGFTRTKHLMARCFSDCPRRITAPERTLLRAQRTAHLTAVAARHGPLKAGCLRQALVVWWLLTRAGYEPVLRIGVRKSGVELEAHAWVEVQGQALENGSEIAAHYAILPDRVGAAFDQAE